MQRVAYTVGISIQAIKHPSSIGKPPPEMFPGAAIVICGTIYLVALMDTTLE